MFLCDFRNSDVEPIEEFEDVLSAVLVIPLIFFITCKRRSFCHECQPFLEGKCLVCLLGLSSTQQGGHSEQTQLPQLCLASSHCFLRERRKHLMFPPVNFFSGINEKKKNLELIMLTCEHNNRGNPLNIWEKFARAEGSECLSQAVHTNPGHNYIYVVFGSALFSL